MTIHDKIVAGGFLFISFVHFVHVRSLVDIYIGRKSNVVAEYTVKEGRHSAAVVVKKLLLCGISVYDRTVSWNIDCQCGI